MEVKCPKCRFRYDTPVSAGISEVACVCPRCGTPFVFAVGGTQETPDNGLRSQGVEEGRSVDNGLRSHGAEDYRNQGAGLSADADFKSASSESGISNPLQPSNPLQNPNPLQPSSPLQQRGGRSHGCLRNCLIVFLVVFVGAVVAVRNCYGDRSYRQAMLENGVNESLDEFGDGSVVNDYEDFIVEGAETPPDWLQGTWRTDTDAGPVVIVIHGRQIAEQSGGEISRGTYYYKKKKLYCKFREIDEVEIRHVSTRRQCIVYDNRDMEKQ